MAYTAQSSAAALNRAFNNANATPTAFAATVAELTADTRAAANKFDDGTLTDLALSTKILTNLGILPSTVTEVMALEAAVADYFTANGKENRGFVVLQLAEILSGITEATNPLFVYYGAAATAWNTEVAASVADATSTTAALTTSTTDSLVGGSADDIFSAISAALSTVNTLNTTDKINGGAGIDTLNLTLSKANTAFTTGSVAAVETVVVNNTTEQPITLDASKFTGVTTYTINGDTATTNLSNVETGLTTLNLNNFAKKGGAASATTFSLAYGSAAAEITGTANALAVNLNSVGSSSTKVAALTIDSVETVNVALTGTNFASLAGSAIKSIVVTGSGSNTKFGSVPTTVTSFDASAATGNVGVDLSTTTATLTKVALGSGADTVTYAEQDGSAIATLSGGAGNDTLTLNSDGGTVEYTMTGFETLALGTVSGALTLSGAKTTDLGAVSSTSTVSAAVSLLNMGSGALAVTATGSTVDAGGISSDHTGATTLNYAADTGTASTTADAPLADYTFSKSAGTLTVNNAAYVANAGSTIKSDASTAVILNIASGLDSAGTTEKTIFNSSIQADKATTLNINATGQLGTSGTPAQVRGNALTTAKVVNGTSAGYLTFTTGSTANVVSALDITTGEAFTLTAGSTSAAAGSATTMDKVETLTVAANKGLTTLADALAKVNVVTLSGSGTTTSALSQVNIGNLGAANSADLTLTATGLKGGLSSNSGNSAGPTIDVGLGFDINVNVDGTTGTVFLGNVGSLASNSPDDVTISAKKATGAFTVGSVTGSGIVSVVATGSTSASTVGNVSGDEVTVNVGSTGAGSNVGTITAKTSATAVYSSIEQTVETILASSTSTALAVSVTTGILADTMTITGGAAQTSITVTGDLGSSTDDVQLTSNTTTATAQTISLAGLSNYETSTITTGSKKDTIVGGVGADIIYGRGGQDTLTGNGGKDSFRFDNFESTYLAPDTITDLGSTDEVWYGGGTVALSGAVTAVAGSKAKIDAYGVATFNSETTAPATFTAAATLVEASVYGLLTTAGTAALFSYGGSTYMFISDGASGLATSDVVIMLTGVSLPNAALVDGNTATTATGLSGLGS